MDACTGSFRLASACGDGYAHWWARATRWWWRWRWWWWCMHVSISAFASLIACHFAFWSSSSERSCARIHAVLRPRLWGEGRARLYRAISALVDLPGVASPLECDWWLLEGCASGLVMSGLSQDVRDGRDKIRNSRNYGSQGNSIFLAYTVNTVSFDMAWFGAIFRKYLISVKINCYLFCDCSTKRIIHYRFSVAHFTCFVTYCTQHSACMCLFRDRDITFRCRLSVAFRIAFFLTEM